MNIERIEQLIKRLEFVLNKAEGQRARFDMNYWLAANRSKAPIYMEEALERDCDNCGTVACIAGHTVLMFKEEILDDHRKLDVMGAAQRLLDLTWDEACWLFLGGFSSNPVQCIELKEALAALKHLAAGEPLESPIA